MERKRERGWWAERTEPDVMIKSAMRSQNALPFFFTVHVLFKAPSLSGLRTYNLSLDTLEYVRASAVYL